MSWMAIFIGEGLVGCKTQKQKSIALSTSEAEYIALSDCARDVRWIRELMVELGISMKLPTEIKEDNSGAITWSGTKKRAKHVAIRYHFVRDMVKSGLITVTYCPTRYLFGVLLVEPMKKGKFEEMRKLFNMFEGNSAKNTGNEAFVGGRN